MEFFVLDRFLLDFKVIEVGVIFCSGKNLSDRFKMLFIPGSMFGLVRNFDIKGNQSITFFAF
jgi:hypothetical protein